MSTPPRRSATPDQPTTDTPPGAAADVPFSTPTGSPQQTRQIPLYPALRSMARPAAVSAAGPVFPGFDTAGAVSGTVNARSAIEIALRTLDLAPGSEVLVPSYHCPVMIYPIVKLGLVPVWFNVAEDCSIDMDDLEQRIGPNTAAVIAVHYFGFPTSLAALRRLCDARDLFLIEDCAHAFFGWCDGAAIGSVGDIAVASYYKFFPVQDGGAIRFNNPVLDAHQSPRPSSPLFFQLKSALNTLERRRDADNPNRLLDRLLQLQDWLWSRLKREPAKLPTPNKAGRAAPAAPAEEGSSDGIFHPDLIAPTYQPWQRPWFCSAVIRRNDYPQICAIRRSNYTWLLARTDAIEGVAPLFPILPETVVPYNFPLLCDDADGVAARLRAHGISVARFGEFYWDERDRVPASVADTYSRGCIQIPIHQSVTASDLEYIASALGSS